MDLTIMVTLTDFLAIAVEYLYIMCSGTQYLNDSKAFNFLHITQAINAA